MNVLTDMLEWTVKRRAGQGKNAVYSPFITVTNLLKIQVKILKQHHDSQGKLEHVEVLKINQGVTSADTLQRADLIACLRDAECYTFSPAVSIDGNKLSLDK